MASVLTLTDENFAAHVDSGNLLLVDFWATWCSPCRAISSTMDELATEFDGAVLIGKLNVDESPRIALQYNVRSIPAILIFKNGNHVDTIIGAQPKARFVEKLKELL